MSFFKSLANLFSSKPDPPKSQHQQTKSNHEPISSQLERSEADHNKKTPQAETSIQNQSIQGTRKSKGHSSKRKDRKGSKELSQQKSDTEQSGRKKSRTAESSKKKKVKKIETQKSPSNSPTKQQQQQQPQQEVKKRTKKSPVVTSPKARKRLSDDVFPTEALKSGSQRRDAKSPGKKSTNVPVPVPKINKPRKGSAENTDTTCTASVMSTVTDATNTDTCAESSKKRKKTSRRKGSNKKPSTSSNSKEKIVVTPSKEAIKEPDAKSFSITVQQNKPPVVSPSQEKIPKIIPVSSPSAAPTSPTKDNKLEPVNNDEELEEDILADEQTQMPQVLDRPEITRLISELTPDDRQIPLIEHDPFLPLDVLIQRSHDFYSEKRSKNNAAITYEKLAEYEFASTKEGTYRDPNDKLCVKIVGKISREHFDVQTREKVKQDVTDVIDHEPGSNRPPESN